MIAIGVAGALFATVQSHANGRALAHVTGERLVSRICG